MWDRYDVISGWDSLVWIPWTIWNFELRRWLYCHFRDQLLEPFLGKFWFNSNDSIWTENFDVFQSILLTCRNWDLRKHIDFKWFEIVWTKTMNYKAKKVRGNYVLDNYSEFWDDFDLKTFLEEARNWNLYFWFLPWKKLNETIVVFAKTKKVDLWEFNPIEIWEIKQEVDKLLETPTSVELAEASKSWWPLHWFTL